MPSVAPSREPVQDLVHRAVAARGHDQAVPGEGGQLGGVVGVFGVEHLHREATGAQDLRETLQITLVASPPRVGVADDHSVVESISIL